MRIKQELIEKARGVFKEHNVVTVNQYGLSRTDLRQLERYGYVEKLKVFGSRKYSNVTPPMHHIYKWRMVNG